MNSFGEERFLVDTVGLPEMDGVLAGHLGNLGLELGLELYLGQEPGRLEGGSSETAAVAVAVVVEGQAEELQAEGYTQQDTAYHTAAEGEHLVVGIHLELGTAGTLDHPCRLRVPAGLQDRAAAVGALLAVGQPMRRRRCCQVFQSAPLVQLVGGLGPGPQSDQKQR